MLVSSSEGCCLDELFAEILLRAGCAMIAIDRELNVNPGRLQLWRKSLVELKVKLRDKFRLRTFPFLGKVGGPSFARPKADVRAGS
jgi:hypothetical protein